MVNILDKADVALPEGDLLKSIFSKQISLMAKYDEIEESRGALTVHHEMFGELDHRFVQWRIKDLAYRTVEEISEATNCLKNKPWRESEVPTDKAHFYEELADAFHFFLELCVTAGLDAEDLALLYHQKHAVNVFRQESKY